MSGVQFPPSPLFMVPASCRHALFLMEYYVYILQSQLNLSFYKGHTDNLSRRMDEHNAGKVSYSKKFRPWNLVWFASKPTKSQALEAGKPSL
ncbi:MAG: GIY-YIG nuclease family protein [Cyclobacteriaceae bacterium]